MAGVSGGAAELGNDADRQAFQGSMNFLDANTGRLIRKTWTIHPPKQPNDLYAGAGIWSTPAVDTKDKVAFVGAGNPFKPQAEHPHTDAILKFDVNPKSPTFGQIVGSTANDGESVYGPITVPGYLWSLTAGQGGYRWVGPIADGAHWGNPVTVANGIVYTVDFSGYLDAFDARNGTLLTKRPLALGSAGPESLSWAGVSVARNTVYAAVGVLGLADGFVVAYRPGSVPDLANDAVKT